MRAMGDLEPLFRRLSKDYALLPATSEAMIQVTMIHLMIRRLARIAPPQMELSGPVGR